MNDRRDPVQGTAHIFIGRDPGMADPGSSGRQARAGHRPAGTRALATEFSPHGVRVNAMAPGWIDAGLTRRAHHDDPARRARVLERTPLGRFGDPSDVGYAAVYLCSPGARFVTGIVLPVDGGASIGF